MHNVWCAEEMIEAPLLELTNATVVKGGVVVLDAITLTIRTGEHTAIVGPNGSGKTTLINLLTHDDYAWAFENAPPAVRVLGSSRWVVSELRTKIGIVSDDLHRRFVLGNSAGRIKGLDAVLSGFFSSRGFLVNCPVTATMRDEAASALQGVEAGHLADKFLDEMSPGESRRVLIARALVTSPHALVLDEPSAGLDVAARYRFLQLIRRLAREGRTIVLVTHHVEEIIPEIERVIFLKRGRVIERGSKTDMLQPDRLSRLFEAPIGVTRTGGYYHTRAITD
jgi:iron complex transport system ATP-binding protein